MTILVPYPHRLLPLFDNSKRAAAQLIRRLCETEIDIKTIDKLMKGSGRESKMRALIEDMCKRHPALKAKIEEMGAPQNSDYIESWRLVVLAGDWTAQSSAIETQSDRPMIRHLLPLVQQSWDAALAMEKDDLRLARAILRNSPIAHHVPEIVWQRLDASRNASEVEAATIPMRLVAILFVLAVFERELAPNVPTSHLVHCVPIAKDGADALPFARCINGLLRTCGLKPGKQAVAALMDPVHPDSEQRKLRRWTSGREVPSGSYFLPFYAKVLRHIHKAKGINKPFDAADASKGGELLYLGLKAVSTLASVKNSHFEAFGGKVEFFARYEPIFAEIR